jgi:hypothetical protein
MADARGILAEGLRSVINYREGLSSVSDEGGLLVAQRVVGIDCTRAQTSRNA